jgi:cytochrome c553
MPIITISLKRLVIACSLLLIVAACSSNTGSPSASDALPPGDAARGAELFIQSVNTAPACASCHHTDNTILLAPALQGLSERAGNRVSGLSAQEYMVQSIRQPSSFIVPGFSNLM